MTSPSRPRETLIEWPLAFLALGATFVATGMAWCLILAIAASALRRFFVRNPEFRLAMDRITGGLFAVPGARLAWSSP